MEKGDVVLVHATVFCHRTGGDLGPMNEARPESHLVHSPAGVGDQRQLWRLPHKPWRGLVTGRTYLATGIVKYGYSGPYDSYDGDLELVEDKRHIVLCVQPLDTKRWLKPWRCLEADLEVVAHDS